MEFDWTNLPFEPDASISLAGIEESFEDPFAIFFNLGKSATGQGFFSVYRTNGKVIRVVLSRPFSESEAYFYQRRMSQSLSA